MLRVEGNIVDIHRREIFPGEIVVRDGVITHIHHRESAPPHFILPGFIDAHIHVESSMLAPAELSRAATVHGTVATVSDPHEIANVLGLEGVKYMIAEARKAALKIFYGAPSCVPATSFEIAGATLDLAAVEQLLALPDIFYLSELMNFPGVLAGDPSLLAMIAAAKKYGKPVDGHAPQLRAEAAAAYSSAGISTDHECTTLEEAQDKIAAGMMILIREGSAARNYDALEQLLFDFPERCMFCSDDLHPDSLVLGHINRLVKRAVAAGVPLFSVLDAACKNPVKHYRLPVGLLREGDPADFIVVRDLKDFEVLQTSINGQIVAENGRSLRPYQAPALINRFTALPIKPADLKVPATASEVLVNVIVAEDEQLITGAAQFPMQAAHGELPCNLARDILKIVVLNRYQPAPPAVAFIQNFGLKQGAIASSVAHDSHNIVAVGANDDSLAKAINLIIANQGGICAVSENEQRILPLPIAGLMSDREISEVGPAYAAIEELARTMGSTLKAPLMALSFMALLVIPELKLSDRGLFDVRKFGFVPLIAD
ncbi:adenine deaminase [soil metagenome]